jgi:transposase/IS1 family transposase
MSQKTYEELIAENNKLKEENTKLKIKVENQQLHINTLNRYIFGSKRETTPKEENIVEGTQCSIFGVPEDEEVKKQVENKTEEITVYRKKKNKKTQAGIKKSELKNIETITEEYSLNDEEAHCPVCSSNIKPIGKEFVRQEIEYVPAKLILKNYVRNIYKCEKCGTNESEKETPTIIKTKTPRALLSHSFASPSLATEVIYQKYYMGVPLYRQEKVWDDRGLVLPRNMMANWCIKLSEYYFEPIYEMMLKQMKEQSEVLHCDETTMQCNKEQGKKATSNSYMWVIASGELEKKKGVIFYYSKSRSSEIAQNLMKGYKNILITDGYSGYNVLDKQLTHAECWAHTRRYFLESVPLDNNKKPIISSDGYTGVEYINELFKIEREIEKLNTDEKLKMRKEKSEPVLKKFYEWVYSMSEKYITNQKLKKAIIYAINQKENLSKFLNDGRIALTNSKAERAIRPFAVHRKNWLFADTVDGAKANAIYYSLIESAKANQLNINKYIRYLLNTLPQIEGEQTEEEIEKYLPWSTELPEELLNFQETYEDLKISE